MHKLTTAQRRAIKMIQATGPVIVAEGICNYWHGKKFNQATLDVFIREGFLAPAGDGLIPGFSQTMRLTEAAIEAEKSSQVGTRGPRRKKRVEAQADHGPGSSAHGEGG